MEEEEEELIHDRKYAQVDQAPLGAGNFGIAKLMRNRFNEELVAIKYIPRGNKIDENVLREVSVSRFLSLSSISLEGVVVVVAIVFVRSMSVTLLFRKSVVVLGLIAWS
jgi:hypothetical protein